MHYMKWGVVFAFFAVALGAFGAHGLKEILEGDRLSIYQTATQYLFYHALALLIYGTTLKARNRLAVFTGYCFVFGCLVFSGSLYVLSIFNLRVMGAITPLGGIAFLSGWVGWGTQLCKERSL
jgi:uncharacterized membrane protein YgdD (TMEM256/DUF423 family)